jgi:hypothetical protein
MPDSQPAPGEDLHCLHLLDKLHQVCGLQVVVEGGRESGRLRGAVASTGEGDDFEDDLAGDVFSGVAAAWREGYMASKLRVCPVSLMMSWFFLRL